MTDTPHTLYLFEGFQLDVTRRRLITAGGVVKPLNSRAMEALLLLVSSAGELVEKRRLMETVWPRAVVEENNLNQCILAIRRALGEVAGSNQYIMTVPGRGYRFVAPVRRIERESPASSTEGAMRPTALVIASGILAALSLALLLLAWHTSRQAARSCPTPSSTSLLHPNAFPRAYQ